MKKLFLILLLSIAGFSGTADAQSYPTKTIRLVIPYTSGGPTDFVARLYAEQLRAELNGTVIVDSKPGANTAIGTDFVVRSEPDGHTILLVAPMSGIATQYLSKAVKYQFERDLVLVNFYVYTPLVLAINPEVPVKDLGGFIAYAKANPGKINFGSSGVGHSYHLAAELFGIRTGTSLYHIPYKGSSQTMTELVGGRIQMAFDSPSAPLPFVQSNRLRVLGITGNRRLDQYPGVPTFAEQGLTDFNLDLKWGLFVPKGTPASIVQRLHEATAKIVRNPTLVSTLSNQAFFPVTCASVGGCAQELQNEANLVASLIKKAGITPE